MELLRHLIFWIYCRRTSAPQTIQKPSLMLLPIPSGLQQSINNQQEEEFASLLSQHHIQFIYSNHLGPQQQGRSESQGDISTASATPHPVWAKAADLIKASSSTNRISVDTNGFGQTMSCLISQFSTNVTNLWQGSVYDKAVTYLLRVLLRMHLAPEREAAYQEQQAERKSKQSDRSGSSEGLEGLEGSVSARLISRQQWKARVHALCNELSSVVQKASNGVNDGCLRRRDAILGQLERLRIQEQRARSNCHDEPENSVNAVEDCELQDEEEEEAEEEQQAGGWQW